MTISNRSFWLFLYVVGVTLLTGCRPDDSDDSIPYVPFPDISVNLTLPQYFQLQTTGSYVILNDGGVKGIILYHHSTGEFYAFERNCSYHPNDACSTVGIDVTGLRMTDSCCGSFFDFEGNPVGGPAWRPLRRYVTIHQASEVIVTDEVLSE